MQGSRSAPFLQDRVPSLHPLVICTLIYYLHSAITNHPITCAISLRPFALHWLRRSAVEVEEKYI